MKTELCLDEEPIFLKPKPKPSWPALRHREHTCSGGG